MFEFTHLSGILNKHSLEIQKGKQETGKEMHRYKRPWPLDLNVPVHFKVSAKLFLFFFYLIFSTLCSTFISSSQMCLSRDEFSVSGQPCLCLLGNLLSICDFAGSTFILALGDKFFHKRFKFGLLSADVDRFCGFIKL